MYGSTRGGAGGLCSSCPAGNPHRGHSQISGTAASVAKLGRVSCRFEHQKDTQTRGADSPRSASPIGPAPTLLPRMALPLLTEHPLSCGLFLARACRCLMPRRRSRVEYENSRRAQALPVEDAEADDTEEPDNTRDDREPVEIPLDYRG